MCGNNFSENPKPSKINLCNNPCSGNSNEMYGGIVCKGQPSYLSFVNLSKIEF